MLKAKNMLVLLLIAVLLIAGMGITGCAPAQPEAPVAPAEPADPAVKPFAWPEFLRVATPALGTANHSMAVAWGAELSAATGMKVRVLPAPATVDRVEWVAIDEADVSLMQASDYIDSMDAWGPFASRIGGPLDMRVVWISLVTPWGFMVRGDSPIQTIYDVKPGTDVAWFPGAPFITRGIQALLDAVALTTDDVNLVEVGSFGANSHVIGEGRAEITFTSPVSPVNVEVAATPQGVRWLSIPTAEQDPKAYEAYTSRQLGYVMKPVVTGIESAHGLMMDHAYQTWMVRGDMDPDLVYNLAKWFHENHHTFVDDFIHANLMTKENLVAYLDHGAWEPLHEGTIRYLKELGVWTERHQAVQDFNVELSQRHIEAFREALRRADEQGLMVTPGNEPWLTLWQEVREEKGLTESYGLRERP